MKTLMVMAGGTGGHVYPALDVARLLHERGIKVVWLGTRSGLEARIVPTKGIELEWVDIKGLRGAGLIDSLRAPFRLVRALWQAMRIIRRRRPDVLLGMGGYVSGPASVAAILMRLPVVIHEANASAGVTNRLLAHVASRVLTGFPSTNGLRHDGEWVGNPVRPEISNIAAPEERNIGHHEKLFRLLVVGGSQGAEILNQIVPAAIKKLCESSRPNVIHQCGTNWISETTERYRNLEVSAKVIDYIDDMSAAYRTADLLICRSGAMTVAEIAAVGMASILVPLPNVAGDHQSMNATFLAERHAALVMPQSELSSENLASLLRELLNNRPRLLALACSARSLSRPKATERVVECCMEAMGA